MTQLPGLTTLHDGRPGLRTLLQVAVCAPASPSLSQLPSVDPGPVLDFIASTDSLDRYHEIIDPSGWRLDTYRRNPVFQNAHNYGDILFTLGKALITEVRTGADGPSANPYLFQRIQFATDVNPIARIAYGLYKGGFLNAVSVGFIPLRWQDSPVAQASTPAGGEGVPPRDSDPSTQHIRRKYLEQELLEVSAVAIPANPDALALALKSGAIPKSDLRDTLNLLRSLTTDTTPIGPITPIGPTSVAFARELRRILRRA
jgi:uncharacterized protein